MEEGEGEEGEGEEEEGEEEVREEGEEEGEEGEVEEGEEGEEGEEEEGEDIVVILVAMTPHLDLTLLTIHNMYFSGYGKMNNKWSHDNHLTITQQSHNSHMTFE